MFEKKKKKNKKTEALGSQNKFSCFQFWDLFSVLYNTFY